MRDPAGGMPVPPASVAGDRMALAIVWATTLILAAAALLHVDALRFADPDLFVHLYAGREIASNGGPPGVDTATFTLPGAPWHDYEWLSRLVIYRVVRAAGPAGLVVLRLVLLGTVLTALLAVARRHGRGALSYALALGLLVAAAAPYAHFRPQLFTFALLAALLALTDVARDGRRWPLIPFPLLTVAWVNLHAGYGLGIAVQAMLVVSAAGGRLHALRRGRAPSGEARVLAWAAGALGASLLATGLNPYGYGIWNAVFGTLFGAFTPHISEWKPLLAYPLADTWGAIAVAAALVTCLVLARRRAGIFDLLLAGSLIVASFARVRFVPLLGIAGAFVLARLLPAVWARLPRRLPEGAWPRAAATGAAALLLAGVAARESPRDGAIWMEEWFTPVKAVAFLERNGLGGDVDVLNEYDWGGYIRYRIPEARIFVDGRSDTVYPYDLIDAWTRFVDGMPDAYDVPGRYGARMIVLRLEHPVVRVLEGDPAWINTYADETTGVFLLDHPDNAERLARLEGGARAPDPRDLDYRLDPAPLRR